MPVFGEDRQTHHCPPNVGWSHVGIVSIPSSAHSRLWASQSVGGGALIAEKQVVTSTNTPGATQTNSIWPGDFFISFPGAVSGVSIIGGDPGVTRTRGLFFRREVLFHLSYKVKQWRPRQDSNLRICGLEGRCLVHLATRAFVSELGQALPLGPAFPPRRDGLVVRAVPGPEVDLVIPARPHIWPHPTMTASTASVLSAVAHEPLLLGYLSE